ncbi:DUF819 family protein [Rhodocytophaga rosea]|uniref:DUF819 family protein n=1 Tax=Rhodocytophaga rosea TaxID=2704465 RepID=A0A6C0GID5_9BACT|nr:DUF819 family protein [Rhodocytophaga rosea]QHT67729.1 DUF819 family protein [Rhodocytophaga rosea]
MEQTSAPAAYFTNDAVVLGILIAVLAFVFETSSRTTGFWAKFYKYVPSLILCYFIPAILNSLNIISGEQSGLYKIATQYLLPASLVLLTLSMDLKAILRLGPKALIMFLTGTVSIMLGGPLAIFLVSLVAPEVVGGSGPDAVWRGFATIAGSWIGGGANQIALKEVFEPSGNLFSAIIAVDVIIAYFWMGILLFGAGISKRLDERMKADTSAIEAVRKKLEDYSLNIMRIPSLLDWVRLVAVSFISVAVSHAIADIVVPWIETHAGFLDKFSLTSKVFWIVVLTTTAGLVLSFTKARNLEGAGASRLGTLLLYMLVVVIGMQMNLFAIFSNPGLLIVGAIWMLFHAIIMLSVARLIRAPLFFTAVGSMANVGGATSAPVVASAFHPSLATVGVLLAVFGYVLGTYCGYLSAILMQMVAPS